MQATAEHHQRSSALRIDEFKRDRPVYGRCRSSIRIGIGPTHDRSQGSVHVFRLLERTTIEFKRGCSYRTSVDSGEFTIFDCRTINRSRERTACDRSRNLIRTTIR